MRVFITGASGWIGSAAVDALLAAGHEITGVARSDAKAETLQAKGVTVVRGDLDDLPVLRAGAESADAVLHLANKHDFLDQAESNRAERAAVQTFCDALEGTGKPFLFASGLARPGGGGPLTEEDASPFHGPESPRGGAENLAFDHVDRGVRSIALRFAPTVHGPGDHGFIAHLTRIAADKGAAGYVGDGTNSWAAVHRLDAADLIALGLDRAPAGARLHAVAENGVPTREIAEAMGAFLGVPTVSIDPADALAHFGWIGAFFGMEMTGRSDSTRETLGWSPSRSTLLEDIRSGAYALD